MARVTDQLRSVIDTRQPSRVDVLIQAEPGQGGAVRDLLTDSGIQFTSVNVRNKTVFEATITPAQVDRLERSNAIAVLDHSPTFSLQGTAVPIPGEATIASDVNRATLKQVTERLEVPAAWEEGGTRGDGVTIGMIDGPIDTRHPSISDSVRDTERNSGDSLHGTWVASALVGDEVSTPNGTIRGIAPDAELVAHGALSGGGASGSEIAEGVEYCIEKGCDVVNLSFGGPHSDVLQGLVTDLQENGVVPVSSIGNSGPGPATATCPSHHREAMAVGSVDGQGRIAGFSSRGPGWGVATLKPDLCAYGGHSVFTSGEQVITEVVLGAAPRGRSEYLIGTSMAAPQVAGITALSIAADR